MKKTNNIIVTGKITRKVKSRTNEQKETMSRVFLQLNLTSEHVIGYFCKFHSSTKACLCYYCVWMRRIFLVMLNCAWC